MKTLQEYIDQVDPLTKLMKEIQPGMVGYVNNHPLKITAILERTAVVHPLDAERNKILVRLTAIKVPEEDIVWKDKSKDDQRVAKSTSIGRGIWQRFSHYENQ